MRVFSLFIAVADANAALGLQPTPQCADPAQRKAALDCALFGGFGASVKACVPKKCTK